MLNWFTGNYSLLVSYIIKESAAPITAQNIVNLDFRWINYRVPYNYPISIFYRYYYLFLLELVILPFRCSRICCKIPMKLLWKIPVTSWVAQAFPTNIRLDEIIEIGTNNFLKNNGIIHDLKKVNLKIFYL